MTFQLGSSYQPRSTDEQPNHNTANVHLSPAPFGSTEPRMSRTSHSHRDHHAFVATPAHHASFDAPARTASAARSVFASKSQRFVPTTFAQSDLSPGSYTLPSCFVTRPATAIPRHISTQIIIERSMTAPSIPPANHNGYEIVDGSIRAQQLSTSTADLAADGTPSPAHYNARIDITRPALVRGSIMHYDSKSHREFMKKDARCFVPGVGSYQVEASERAVTSHGRLQPSSMFVSIPRNERLWSAQNVAPGPATYCPNLPRSSDKGRNIAFGSSNRAPLSSSSHTPAPGTYEKDVLAFQKKKQKHVVSHLATAARWLNDKPSNSTTSYLPLRDPVFEKQQTSFSTLSSFGCLAPRFDDGRSKHENAHLSPATYDVDPDAVIASHTPCPSSAFHSHTQRFTPGTKEALPLPFEQRLYKTRTPPLSASFADSIQRFHQQSIHSVAPTSYDVEAYRQSDVKSASASFKSKSQRTSTSSSFYSNSLKFDNTRLFVNAIGIHA